MSFNRTTTPATHRDLTALSPACDAVLPVVSWMDVEAGHATETVPVAERDDVKAWFTALFAATGDESHDLTWFHEPAALVGVPTHMVFEIPGGVFNPRRDAAECVVLAYVESGSTLVLVEGYGLEPADVTTRPHTVEVSGQASPFALNAVGAAERALRVALATAPTTANTRAWLRPISIKQAGDRVHARITLPFAVISDDHVRIATHTARAHDLSDVTVSVDPVQAA